MPVSQNVRFLGQAPKDGEYDHPEGAAIARRLESELNGLGWTTKPINNWRDCGWSVACSKDGEEMQIALTRIKHAEWMLQVAPMSVPGIIGRLLGRVPSATPIRVLELAGSVQKVLSEESEYRDFKWCWDGFPQEGTPVPEPPQSDG